VTRLAPYPWIKRTHRGGLIVSVRPAGEVFPHVRTTFEHACAVFAFLIDRGERVTALDWCERIERGYAPHHRRERVIHAIKVCILGDDYAAMTAPVIEPMSDAEFERYARTWAR